MEEDKQLESFVRGLDVDAFAHRVTATTPSLKAISIILATSEGGTMSQREATLGLPDDMDALLGGGDCCMESWSCEGEQLRFAEK